MLQYIFLPLSDPTKTGSLWSTLISLVKYPSSSTAYREPVHLSFFATEHRRRYFYLKALQPLYYCHRALFGLAIVAVLCTPFSAWAGERTTQVSVASNGTKGNGQSNWPAISANGRYVAFSSYADNLVPGDTNEYTDVFVHDRASRKTTRVSLYADGTQANLGGVYAAISATGRFVAFVSQNHLTVPGDNSIGGGDVFVYDRKNGQIKLISLALDGSPAGGSALPDISADGRFVAFWSYANNLVPGDTNGIADVFVHDRRSGQIRRVSVASNGIQGNGFSNFFQNSAISANGRYVTFQSYADNLVPGDTNGLPDAFVHDLSNGKTIRVNVASNGAQGNSGDISVDPVISANGRFVAFVSSSDNLVPQDTNGRSDIFVHDNRSGKTTRVSLTLNGTQQGFLDSFNPAISADGRYVTFSSYDGFYHYNFVHDCMRGRTTLISLASNDALANIVPSYIEELSANGRYWVLYSSSDNLVPGDTNSTFDVFVYNRSRVKKPTEPSAQPGGQPDATR